MTGSLRPNPTHQTHLQVAKPNPSNTSSSGQTQPIKHIFKWAHFAVYIQYIICAKNFRLIYNFLPEATCTMCWWTYAETDWWHISIFSKAIKVSLPRKYLNLNDHFPTSRRWTASWTTCSARESCDGGRHLCKIAKEHQGDGPSRNGNMQIAGSINYCIYWY
jgi:hypothetical protein